MRISDWSSDVCSSELPDMAPVWTWMRERVAGMDAPECLNLFGYTGVGTLAMAARGARMVHVDASKKSVEAAKGNALLSGLADAPVRWIVDDAAKCVARADPRGRRYDEIGRARGRGKVCQYVEN